MIFFAMIGVIVLSLVNVFLIESSFVSLAISFVVVLLMGAYMLSQMSSIINGGETNYISATVGLYLALHNMFTSLLHILGVFNDD
jgi:modulator of FtsH protease